MIDHHRQRRRVGSAPSSSVVLLLLLPSVLLLVRRSHRSSVVAASSVEGALGVSADGSEVTASSLRRRLLFDRNEDGIDEESFSATSPLISRLGNLRLEINPKLLRIDPVFSRTGSGVGDDDGDDDELRERVLDALRRRREGEGVDDRRNLQDGDGGEEGDDGDPEEEEEVECAVDARFDFVYKHALEMGETAYRALTGPPLHVDRMAYVYKAYVDRDGRDEYFGYNDDGTGDDEDEDEGGDGAAGGNSELTGALRSNHERAASFWDRSFRDGLDSNGRDQFSYSALDDSDPPPPSSVETNDVVLLGLHGSDLSVRSNVVESVKIMYAYAWGDEPDGHGDGDGKLTDDEASDVAESIMELIENSLPGGYDNPMLTFRATALSGGTYEALIVEDGGVDDMDGGAIQDLVIPDTIAIGDGFLRFISESTGTTTTGEEDGGATETEKMLAGPLFAHAHEYAHHVHFELVPEEGEFSDLLRVELLADALGSYYLAHPDGADWLIAGDEEEIQDGELEQATAPLPVKSLGDAASVLGDCDLDGTNHHGTPEQRRCAALWGARKATKAEGPGTYYHPEALRSMFDEELGAILSLDAEACGVGFDWNAVVPPREEGNVNSTSLPSSAPSAGPTTPSPTASRAPSSAPSSPPTPSPTVSARPSSIPSDAPSGSPTVSAPPSSEPSGGPSLVPTTSARPSSSFSPSGSPSSVPSDAPTVAVPTALPTEVPIEAVPTATPPSPSAPAEGDPTVAPSPPNDLDPNDSSDPERGSSVSARSSGAGLAPRHRLVTSAAAAAAALAVALWS